MFPDEFEIKHQEWHQTIDLFKGYLVIPTCLGQSQTIGLVGPLHTPTFIGVLLVHGLIKLTLTLKLV